MQNPAPGDTKTGSQDLHKYTERAVEKPTKVNMQTFEYVNKS